MVKENSLDFTNAITLFKSIFKLRFNYDKNNIFIDATAGNGEDTKFLATLGYVYSFDIQEEAIKATRNKVSSSNVKIIKDSHVNIDKYVSQGVNGAVFNLGYLPGGDKTITTIAENTLIALKKILVLLKRGGLVMIVLYPGHEEGLKEELEILKYIESLNQKEFTGVNLKYINRINNSPYPILIERL